MIVELATGAQARWTGERAEGVVLLMNGGSSKDKPGTWSATIEWLVRELAPRHPALDFLELRYRIRSWRRLDSCAADAGAALDAARSRGARRVLLVGFSMGGAVAIGVADDPLVAGVVGLAPWIPDRLDGSTLAGKPLRVLHGTLDAWLPLVPGVSWRHTLRGVERMRAAGNPVEMTLIPGAVHGAAVRPPWGLQRLPRAARWRDLLGRELSAFRGEGPSS